MGAAPPQPFWKKGTCERRGSAARWTGAPGMPHHRGVITPRPPYILLIVLWLGGCASSGRDWASDAPERSCRAGARFTATVAMNAQTLDTLDWAPFGAPELGWRIYAPQIAAEIGTRCGPETAAFAARLARWQRRNGVGADGALTPAVFDRMKSGWQARRPFVALRAQGVCPDAPEVSALARLDPQEGYMGKEILLAPGALHDYRRLRAAARRALRSEALEDQTLTVFSGFRSPDYDAERCAREQNCQGVTRAQCSAHRTGAALDLVVGAAEGYTVDASAQPNRLVQSESAAYRWLVANARRFGFVNYVFEPWHWEWTGAERSN